jgi:abortive phage resistance protein-like protein
MIIRFLAKNIYSFKEQIEFNLLPSSTITKLSHHKIRGDIGVLRYSAIYGGNGVGKSNLIKAISLLEDMVVEGRNPKAENIKFKIGDENKTQPISLGIEFAMQEKVFFYTVTFDKDQIIYEYLAEILKDKEEQIFERYLDDDGNQKIEFTGTTNDLDTKAFFNALSKLVTKEKLATYFLAKEYPLEFPNIKLVYDWFNDYLVIIRPDMRVRALAYGLYIDNEMMSFANEFISNLNLGITEISIEDKKIEESIFSQNETIGELIDNLKKDTNEMSSIINRETGEEVILLNQDGDIHTKRVITIHNDVKFNMGEESDGTRRLFDYIPALKSIIKEEKVYIIDEIERSIHPLLIKEIISKLTQDENIKGQLIFTTHESNLLDQSILRPDEIWLTEKNKEGATEIYPLSDFQIHNTINIEDGYLNGRYGGIPMLSNFKELNWSDE